MSSYLFEVDNVQNELGFLGFLENGKIPFDVRRCYYLTGVDEKTRRGLHGHLKLQQILIAPIGSFEVKVINKYGENNYVLDKPNVGLYIPEMSWRELSNFSKPSCCLVLASEVYEENDYVHDFQLFTRMIDSQT